MVVGEKEKTDVKYDREATLYLKNKKYDSKVYGDKNTPSRRDIFPPSNMGPLPNKTKVEWMGKKYNANLSYRYGSGGRRIPVYTWNV